MNIPVFHDDQHDTAIIVSAAVLNGLDLAAKKIGDVKIVGSAADTPSSIKMGKAVKLIQERAPELECDGEMEADTALVAAIRDRVLADVLPGGDPILIGAAKPAHILTRSVTARGVVNKKAGWLVSPAGSESFL